MIAYQALYRELCEQDAAVERELVEAAHRPPEQVWTPLWSRQHGLSPLAFQELLWRLRAASRVEDVLREAGTVHLGLSLLEILARHGIVAVSDAGTLDWREPLFPEIPPRCADLHERLGEWIAALRPEAQFGQLQASTDSSMRRVQAMLRDLPALGRSVLFLGDDDLTSVLLANAIAGSVTVMDVDVRVLGLLGRIAGEHRLDLTPVEHDVRKPLGEEFRRRFDTVHCDPVDDGPWLEQWLHVAVAALLPVVGARLFLSLAPRRLGERYLGVHRFLQEQGFVLERRERNLNAYAIDRVEDAFYRTHLPRVADAAWRASVDWAVHTDLLVFRYEGSARHLWPQEYREQRRGV